ncbi:type IV secretion system DNA-binding domain-containing protein [Candidatus Microgenomates bacterium]|nr:type IV secretion system DNA-binding domain-containing protein [Candidatus Microgenomates bacterium]
MTDEQKQDVNFFAKTNFRNQETIFGIKTIDRRRHVYIVGKTGTGKSTLIANMAIDDIRKGRGVGIIDPHGDLSEVILDYIPARRVSDVVYLEPFDSERPFSLNVLEIKNRQHKDLVASGIISIFYKLYRESWGPRLEYILRNVILTLLEVEGSTLVDILNLLNDRNFRERVVDRLQDPVLKNFWQKEFERMSDNLRTEAISPIQNKVGQFVSSKMIRNIVGNPKSTIDLEQIMNEGKILILNLSQGKLGEDNASLLGAMIITQLQLAAMNRSFTQEEERRDFFLYVDEFQNFATSSFIKILSEARKYRLSLTLANQYIGQLEEGIQKAIFGNAGTLLSFVVGATDARILTKEFGELYTENDLVALGKYEIIARLSIDNMTSSPFPANTLPLPSLKNENKDKIKRLSRERYGRKVKE